MSGKQSVETAINTAYSFEFISLRERFSYRKAYRPQAKAATSLLANQLIQLGDQIGKVPEGRIDWFWGGHVHTGIGQQF